MGKRPSQTPALYEMMRTRQAAARDVEVADVPPPRAAVRHEVIREPAEFESESNVATALFDVLRPGRTLRVPVGYVLLALGLLILLLSIAYALGNSRGERAAERRFGENFGTPPLAEGVTDPLTLDSPQPPPGGQTPTVEPNRSGGTPAGVRTANWGPVEPKADPRQKGWNYFILAETTPTGALRLAEHCRTNGLETYVVAGKNGRRRVIAFPGYQGSRLAPDVRALEDRIHAIGDKYKSESKGETNMRDAYPSRFDG